MPLELATGMDDAAFPISLNEWNASVRRHLEMPSLSDYGTVEPGGDISAAMTAAIADAASNNTRQLRIPAGEYVHPSTITIDADGLEIHGFGARISSSLATTDPLVKMDGDGIKVHGLSTLLTAGTTTAHHYRMNGADGEVHFCHMDYSTPQSTPAFYLRNDGARVTHCTHRGSNAFMGYVEGSNLLVAFNDSVASSTGDDFFALKAQNKSSNNVRLIGNRCKFYSSILGIGSNIGAQTDIANDLGVRGVTCIGNTGEDCASLLNIRPGGGSTDYFNGEVADVIFSSNTLIDLTGAKFEVGMDIKPSRGGTIRNVRGSGNVIRARSSGASGPKAGVLSIRNQGSGGSDPVIEGFAVEVAFEDPHDGAAFGTAGTSGHPVENFVVITPADLILDDINLILTGNGSRSDGIYVGAGADNKVLAGRMRLSNCNTAALAAAGGFRTASAIIVMTDDIIISTASGAAKITDSGGSFTANTNPLLV